MTKDELINSVIKGCKDPNLTKRLTGDVLDATFESIRKAIKNYEEQEIPSTFYIHSWELTPEFMPKIKLPFKENFITFHNINKAYSRMECFLKEFQFSSFDNFFHNTPKKFSSII